MAAGHIDRIDRIDRPWGGRPQVIPQLVLVLAVVVLTLLAGAVV